jgi:hypothetical protein
MFAVRIAAIPRSSSQRARHGTGIRCRAAYSTTIELAYTRPSIVAGSSRAVILAAGGADGSVRVWDVSYLTAVVSRL